mmetsp:Transcript_12533/g.50178  ORF Transcript_12533/g.50178 Transcript_12533/m.50178 type:complete len:572 (-) Transcript_12533:111-1826(-)
MDLEMPCPTFSVLTVRIWEGRDLAAKDIGGTSDPYCIYGFCDKKGRWLRGNGVSDVQMTAVVEKCLAPKWLTKEVDFRLPEGKVADFRVEVWDKDKMSKDDFMGCVLFPYDELQEGEEKDQWFALQEREQKRRDKVSGEIRISYTYNSAASLKRRWEEARDALEQERTERSRKRGRTIARSNVHRWLTVIEQADEEEEWIEAAIELHTWTYNATENVKFFFNCKYFPKLMKAIRTRLSANPDHRLFTALACGVIGNVALVPEYHAQIFEEGGHEFCLQSVKYITVKHYREHADACCLLIYPFTNLTADSETCTEEKRVLANLVASLMAEVLGKLSKVVVDLDYLVTLVAGTLANVVESMGSAPANNEKVVMQVAHVFDNWPGLAEALSHCAYVFRCLSEDESSAPLLQKASEVVVNGLCKSIMSQFGGSAPNFDKNEALACTVVPSLAYFSWICNKKLLTTTVGKAPIFLELAQVLKEYTLNTYICHNTVNIIYACLARGSQPEVTKEIEMAAHKLMPALTKTLKMYARHQHIVQLGAKIVKTLQQCSSLEDELRRCDIARLIEAAPLPTN